MPDFDGLDLEKQVEERKNNTPYIDAISNVHFFDAELRPGDELIERQKSILSELPSPELLAEQLVAEIIKDRKDVELHSNLKKIPFITQEIGQHARSLLFEKVVQIEKNQYFSKEEPIPADQVTTRWADPDKENAITEVLKHPPFKELFRSRKADLVGIQMRERDSIGPVEGGIFVITSSYEVKSGRQLDYRAYRQMKGGEIKTVGENMGDFAKAINELSTEQAKELGLEGMGKNGKRLLVLKRIRQHIVMPRNVDIDDIDNLINRSGHHDHIGKNDTFNQSEYDDFKNMLSGRHPETKVILHNSAITGKELDKLLDQVLPLVKSILEKK